METKQEHYESMMQAIARYAPSADLEVIQRAYEYADDCLLYTSPSPRDFL